MHYLKFFIAVICQAFEHAHFRRWIFFRQWVWLIGGVNRNARFTDITKRFEDKEGHFFDRIKHIEWLSRIPGSLKEAIFMLDRRQIILRIQRMYVGLNLIEEAIRYARFE